MPSPSWPTMERYRPAVPGRSERQVVPMARPTTKSELIDAAEARFDSFTGVIDSLDPVEREAAFIFEIEGRKGAHWARDKNVRDVLIHLHEWHNLLLRWVEANLAGEDRTFLPETYTWRNYGRMNMELWRRHQGTSLTEAEALLRGSHERVMILIRRFSDDELFVKGRFPWTGTPTLGSYCVSATLSHYDWAAKKLRLHRRTLRAAGRREPA